MVSRPPQTRAVIGMATRTARSRATLKPRWDVAVLCAERIRGISLWIADSLPYVCRMDPADYTGRPTRHSRLVVGSRQVIDSSQFLNVEVLACQGIRLLAFKVICKNLL